MSRLQNDVFGLPDPTPTSGSVLRDALRRDDWTAGLVNDLASLVDGIDELEALNADPLPAQEFEWSSAGDGDRARIGEILDAIKSCSCVLGRLELLDDEYWTIIHRLTTRVAERSPHALRRSTPVRTAAAVTWLAMCGNGALHRRGGLTAALIWQLFGVSSAAELGRALHVAAGLADAALPSHDAGTPDVWLCDVSLLHSRTRAMLIARRESTIATLEREEARRAEQAPLRLVSGGVRVRARPVIPRWAIRAPDESGRAAVLVTFGHDADDVEVLALAVPDAYQLVQMLQAALAGPHLSG